MKKKHTADSAFLSLCVLIGVLVFFSTIVLALAHRTTRRAPASIITVINLNDSGPGSLRQALADANDGDTIDFAVSGTVSLTSGELVIDKNITISGPGSNSLTVRPSQGSFFRVFNVTPSHSITIQGLTVSFGYAGFAQGAGIFLDEHVTATVSDCLLTNNYTGDIGGAIFIDGYGGGAILTVLNSTITGNTAGTSAHGGMGAGIYSNGATLTISNSTVSNNTAWFGSDYFGGYGGGIVTGDGGTLEISNTTITGNQTGLAGGGLSIFSGTATINNSTISGNIAGFEFPPTGVGGGISNSGILTIINSIISGNTANGSEFKGGGEGGGIYGGTQIRNSTVSDNQASVHGGCISGGTFDIGNSILNAGGPENIYDATVTSQGYNVCSDDGGGFLNGPGDQINTDPLLGPLQDNGGPTFTHELLTGSPAIDAGDPKFTPPPYYNQRGPDFWRVSNGRIDAGSFEVRAGSTPTPTPTSTPTPNIYANAESYTDSETPPYPSGAPVASSMKKKLTAQSGLFSLRPLLALFFCAAAICSMIVTGTPLAFWRSDAPAQASQRTLTFAERVAYQRAIEEVYWRHRIWSTDRLDPKPSLDAVISQAQLEKKVQDYLRSSQVLQDYLQRPITAEQLQTEIDRMAQHSRQPEVLRELFAALGDDPFVIAECLGRPALVERLFKSAVATQHASWPVRHRINSRATQGISFSGYTLPRRRTALKSDGTCSDVWAPTGIVNAPTAREWHTIVWTGSEMIAWGGWDSTNYLNIGGRYNPATDSWTAITTTNAPAARARHTAVWTGSEMIVWGGIDPDYLNTGGRYNPATDSWVATSTTNAPSARLLHTAVWTETEMIVWGGKDVNELPSNTGGRYNPSTDSWTATSTTNAPAARFYHTAVWTGSEMIAWGGEDFSSAFNTGGRYSPITDTWAATNTTDAPAARYFHTAVWTSDEMVVWGGYNGCNLDTGGRYDPGTDTWSATSTTNAPSARDGHTAVWANSEMIVWGGSDFDRTNTGGRYNPAANAWIATSTTNAPAARDEHTAVWTDNEMIIWGGIDAFGLTNTGGRYCDQHPIARLTPSRTPRPTPSSIVSSVPTSTRTAAAAATSTPCTPVLLLIETFDNVTPPQLPPGWIAINAIDPDGVPWMTSNSGGPLPPADSPPNAAFVNDPNAISDKRLQSPSIFLSEGPDAVQITFSNNFNLQAGFDGGVLEISIDGGATFQDILARGTFISGGYNGMISVCSDNPLAGRQAWTGNSGGFITTTVSLPVVTWGPEMILRWRMVSDSTVFGEGWRVDTLIVSQCQQTPTPTPTATSTSTPRVTPTPRRQPTPRSRPTAAPRP